MSPTIGPRRTEQDFVDHIARTVDGDPDARWIFVLDNLNTHNSEALVRFVASHCGLDVPLGAKGESGVLRSMERRAAFLSDPSHRIRFVYTPKHCSWLNQIWFSILVRRLLRRASFSSLDDLHERLVEFIAFFNKCGPARRRRARQGAEPARRHLDEIHPPNRLSAPSSDYSPRTFRGTRSRR